MYWLIVLLDPSLSLPSTACLNRFPSFSIACQQIARCERHIERLEAARRLHGHQGGTWERATEEMHARLAYWKALRLCHEADRWQAEGDVRRLLETLRQRIGAERFLEGWWPELLGACCDRPETANAAGQ